MSIKIWMDEEGAVCIKASYDADFIDALKDAIPFKKRRWDPEEKVWICSGGFIDDILGIAGAFFPGAKLGKGPRSTVIGEKRKKEDGAWNKLQKLMGPEEYKSLFRILAKKCHPDTGGSHQKMLKLTELWGQFMVEGKKK